MMRLPSYQSPLRKTGVDVHLPYLRERWEAGCHNMAQLYRELRERGYKGSYQSMHDQLLRLLPGGKKNAAKACNPSPQSLRLSFFFVGLKPWRPMNKRRSSPSDTLTQRLSWPTPWLSSLPRCCAH